MIRKLLVLIVLLLPALSFGQQAQVTGTLVVQARRMQVSFSPSFSKLYENVPYTGNITVTGGISPYTCSLSSGSLPAGTSLSGCVVSGTPTGTATVSPVIMATDSLGQTATGTNTVTTSSLSSIAVTGSSLIIATAATQQLVGTGTWSDGTTSDLTTTCTWSSGTGGVATVGAATGLVTGVAGGTSLISCVFNAVTGSATVTVTANPSVATASLLNAQVNRPYAPQTLMATGGTPPFTWAVTVGALPTGLSLASSTGAISGTPTGTTTTFSVVATDSLSVATAAKSLTLTVATVTSPNTVVCTPSTIQAGNTSQCVSTAHYSDGSTADVSMGSTLAQVNTARASNATGSLVSSLQTSAFVATAGNLLVVGSRHGTDFVSAITATDTAGNTFTAIGSLTVNSPNLGVGQMLYAKNITGNAADQVTCTFAAPVAYNDCIVLQISGVDTGTPLDVHSETGVGASATNSCITGSFTTTVANEALVSYCTAASLNAVFSPGAGYNVDVQDADGLGAIESKIVSAIQTGVTATTSFNGAAKQTIGLVSSFKAGASAGAAWSSGTNSTATVNGQGLVTGLVGGSSVISAVYGGQTGTATVTVTGGAVTAITVTPSSVSGPNGSTQQFTAADQSGGDITGSVTWASTTISCVTMSPTGLATVVSSTACGSSNNITATSGQISGFATFTGTGTPSSAGLLSGCTVSSSNVPSCATPAGWTLVSGVAFENGTGGNGTIQNMSIGCTFAHTGSCAVKNVYPNIAGNIPLSWQSPDLVGTRDMYVSWWEYDDSIGRFNVDFDLGGMFGDNQITDAIVRFQVGCGSHSAGNSADIPFWWNAITERPVLYVEGKSGTSWPNYANYGWTGGIGGGACLSPNAPSWGNWTQWEIRFKSNTPIAFNSATADGQFQVYQNGTLVANVPVNSPHCTGDPVGTPASCSNFSALNDLASIAHRAQVGGVYTVINKYSPSSPTCATVPNASPFVDVFQNNAPGAAHPCTCANQCPPSGFVPAFNRYYDDIIVLKR